MNIFSRDWIRESWNANSKAVSDLELCMAQYSGFFKMMTGAANSAAISIARDCHDHVKRHPLYRHRVKQLFRAALIDEYKSYHRRLMDPRPGAPRFFDVSAMLPSARKKYGAMTDQQYFEFWEGTGALPYQKSQPLVRSLWNKFRLSMEARGVVDADLVAWGCVGATVLELAVTVWQCSLRSVHEALEGRRTLKYLEGFFAPLSISRISAAWQVALTALSPEASSLDLDANEERNVALGVKQLQDLWKSPDLPFDATIQAVEDFTDDIFATKGQAKKVVLELSEIRNGASRSLDEEMKKQ